MDKEKLNQNVRPPEDNKCSGGTNSPLGSEPSLLTGHTIPTPEQQPDKGNIERNIDSTLKPTTLDHFPENEKVFSMLEDQIGLRKEKQESNPVPLNTIHNEPGISQPQGNLDGLFSFYIQPVQHDPHPLREPPEHTIYVYIRQEKYMYDIPQYSQLVYIRKYTRH